MTVIATQRAVESATGALAWFPTDRCFIDGRWVPAQSGAFLPVEDPSRGVEIESIARGSGADIDIAVEAAERALAGPWGRLLSLIHI